MPDEKIKSRLPDNLFKRIVIIVAGSVVAAYGITLAMYAGFGGATLAVLWQGISKTFGISIGAASFVVALAMILFAAVYDRKQLHIGTVLYQIVYSGCVDLFANLHVYSGYVWIKFLIMLPGGKFGICTVVTVIVSGPVILIVNAKSKKIFRLS